MIVWHKLNLSSYADHQKEAFEKSQVINTFTQTPLIILLNALIQMLSISKAVSEIEAPVKVKHVRSKSS